MPLMQVCIKVCLLQTAAFAQLDAFYCADMNFLIDVDDAPSPINQCLSYSIHRPWFLTWNSLSIKDYTDSTSSHPTPEFDYLYQLNLKVHR